MLLAICNQKGGVGKTTTAENLGAALAEMGASVLLVDGDASGDLTSGLGFDPAEPPIATRPATREHPKREPGNNIFEVAVTRAKRIEACILRTEHGPHLVPANEDLAAADLLLLAEHQAGRRDYRTALREALAPVRDAYDFTLIDCPPTLGAWTINALAAADQVLVPAACHYRSWRALHRLMDSLAKARAQFNAGLRVAGILPTMYDARTNHSKEVLESIQEDYGGQARIFPPVRLSVRYQESPLAGVPALHYAPEIAETYRAVARILIGKEQV